MAARITEVCEAVEEFLAEIIAPAHPDEVGSNYVARDVLKELSGKKVRVFPSAYSDVERLARKRVWSEYRVHVLVEELYRHPASAGTDGPIPDEWTDARVAWVQDNVYGPLNDAFQRKEDGFLLDSLRTETCEVVTVYDLDRLDQMKLFWSLIEVSYREQAEG